MSRQIDISSNNILTIHKQVCDIFSHEHDNLGKLYMELEKLKWISENGLNAIDTGLASTKLAKLRQEIKTKEGQTEYACYLAESFPILTQYEAIPAALLETKETKEKRNNLVEDYYRILGQYMTFSAKTQAKSTLCSCGSNSWLETDGQYICSACSCYINPIDSMSGSRDDSSSESTKTINVNNQVKHFEDTMDYFECKENFAVTEADLNMLKEHMTIDVVITKLRIYNILKSKKMSKHYVHVHLLYSTLTGVTPHNISMYRADFNAWFQEFQKAFLKMRSIFGRNNLISIDYILYRFLKRVGYRDMTDDDFYSINEKKKLDCKVVFDKIAEHLKWKEFIEKPVFKKFARVLQ